MRAGYPFPARPATSMYYARCGRSRPTDCRRGRPRKRLREAEAELEQLLDQGVAADDPGVLELWVKFII